MKSKVVLLGFCLLLLYIGVTGCGQVLKQSINPEQNIQTKIVAGKVNNILSPGAPISSAIVLAGQKSALSENDGSYQLSGISSEVRTISSAANGFAAVTIPLSGEVINIPMGITSASSYSPVTGTSIIRGRLIDSSGNPISGGIYGSNDKAKIDIVFENSGYSSIPYWNDGTFSVGIEYRGNIDAQNGYIIVIYEESTGTYKAAIKEITAHKGITLEVGDILLNEPAVAITGAITPQNGFNTTGVSCMIVSPAAEEIRVTYVYNGHGISGNSYVMYVPATPAGTKYNMLAWFGNGSDLSLKYQKDLFLSSGQDYVVNLAMPTTISPTVPTANQAGIEAAPIIKWTSMGEENKYWIFVGKGSEIIWHGITDGISIEYPKFPADSVGGTTNLQSGQEYYLRIIGFNPNINMCDIKYEELMNYTDYYQTGSIPFVVGSASSVSINSFNMYEKQLFDEKVNNILESMKILPKRLY